MTGTSLDGIDVAICQISAEPQIKLIAQYFEEYPTKIREKLHEMMHAKFSAYNFSQMNFLLAKLNAEAVKNACQEAGVKALDAVGVHGQTLWHEPNPVNFLDYSLSSTFQLINGPMIAQMLDTQIVYDFRSADLAVGGQGAPLVAIFDRDFLSFDSNRVTLNIGGIANITILHNTQPVTAFDTGPGNMLIDMVMKDFYNKDFDESGETASKGNIINDLLNLVMSNEFIDKMPPKTTGREQFGRNFLVEYLNNYRNEKPADIVRTLSEFTARSITRNIELFAPGTEEVVASGGGAHNDYIMKRLAELLPQASIKKTDDYGIPGDMREAMCFAYLAWLRLAGKPGNIPSVTGANQSVLLGVIA